MVKKTNMEKINKGDALSESKDLISENIAKLKELFPEIVTENNINFKILKDILGEEIETEEEYYRFTWAGKTEARREAHKPSTGTLRPAKKESVNWDTTKNIYIEGDNLEVLKLLQKSYAQKIKMIYIDPPYNTGKDFVYKDNYKDNLKNYQQITGQVDDEGNKLSTNTDTDGRFHSNWLNMMYPRLKLARNLLKDDGVIFMSIDDNEVDNLRKLGNEIFGEENFSGEFIWKKKQGGGNDSNILVIEHEYIISYSKKINNFKFQLDKKYKLDDSLYPFDDEKGEYGLITLDKSSIRFSESLVFEITDNDGNIYYPRVVKGKQSCWRWGKDKVKNEFDKLVFKNGKVYTKYYRPEGIIPKSLLINPLYGRTESGSDDIKKIFDNQKPFSYPKPVQLLTHFSMIGLDENSIILDFFSGSATTAHAVMQLNAEDNGNRQHIQVQLPEETAEKSEAYKAGYKTIADIGKERIRRAGTKILEEQKLLLKKKQAELNKEKAKNELFEEANEKIKTLETEITTLKNKIKDLDIGFKVFKLDSSNIKSWDGSAEALKQDIYDTRDNLKFERTQEDVLYEILLKYGLDLTLPIEERIFDGKKVFNVGLGAIFICLDNEITRKVAIEIGKWKHELNPEVCRVIFKDSGLTDIEKTNSIQILKNYGINEVKSI